MRQLTIRGLDEPLFQRLQQLARQEGVSLNKAALLLLKRGAGLDPSRQQAEEVGHSLDHLIGAWSAGEEQSFLKATRLFDQITDRHGSTSGGYTNPDE